MYNDKSENVEVYFICYKKEEMELVDTYYDSILDVHYWYFNAYLAYKYWRKKFRNIGMGEIAKSLLTIAASRYIMYALEIKDYKTEKEHKRLNNDLKKIEVNLEKIINKYNGMFNLK